MKVITGKFLTASTVGSEGENFELADSDVREDTRMVKRNARRGAVVAVLLGALALSACASSGGSSSDPESCTPAPKGEKVTLSLSTWIPNFQETVDLWNSEHPDIQVDYTEVTQGNQGTYQTYLNQIKAGKTADLGYFDYDVLPTFRIADGLRNLYKCAGVADAQDKFIKSAWTATTFGQDKSIYGLGLDFTPEGLFYRADLFKQAGIPVPTTWDEYYQAAKAVRATGGYIANLPSWGTFWPTNWMQAGKKWFELDGDTWKVNIATDENKQIADRLQQLVDEKLVTTYPLFQDEYSKALNDGVIWSQLGGPWGFRLIPSSAADTAGNWSLTKMPVIDGSTSIASWGGAAMGVFKNSAHPYEAAEFALWATTDPKALALNSSRGGIFPPIKDVVSQVPEMQATNPFFGDQAVFKEMNSWAEDVNPEWLWGPTMVQVNADLESEMAKALSGQQTIFDALKVVQGNTVDAIKSQGLSVTQ
ncbi:ABC transporter substrate-binding protein [Subtercola frigoramans]|nr:extracellular solute-binding protein [Subtercola frigoramans]